MKRRTPHHLLLLLFTLFLCNSCLEKVIEFEGAAIPPQRLVIKVGINGTHYPGRPDSAEIEVTHSRFRFDPKPIQHIDKDIRILLYGNDQLKEEITLPQAKPTIASNGEIAFIPMYYSYYSFQPGDHVRMEIVHPNFPIVRGEGVLPSQAKILDCQFNSKDELLDQTTVYYNSLKLKIQNPSDQLSYFRVRYRINEPSHSSDPNAPGMLMDGTIRVSEEPIFGESTDLFGSGTIWDHGIYVFTNTHFAKEPSYILNLYLPSNQKEIQGDHYVVLEQITRDSYLYYASVIKKKQVQDDFFTEPVNVYSSLEGGIGVLHLKTEDSFHLLFPN